MNGVFEKERRNRRKESVRERYRERERGEAVAHYLLCQPQRLPRGIQKERLALEHQRAEREVAGALRSGAERPSVESKPSLTGLPLLASD